jgi:hypothetical protein
VTFLLSHKNGCCRWKGGCQWKRRPRRPTTALSLGNGPFPFNNPLLFVIPERTRISYFAALTGATYVVLLKENHMQLFEAATLDRKSGEAEGSAVRHSGAPNLPFYHFPFVTEVIRRYNYAWDAHYAEALVNLFRQGGAPLMRLGAVSVIAIILAVAAAAFEGRDNNAPWYPSLQAFEHYNSGRSHVFSRARSAARLMDGTK